MKAFSSASAAGRARDKLFSRWTAAHEMISRLLRSQTVSAAISFFLGFFLTRAVFSDGYAPLGVSFTAADQKHPLSAAAGALVGYIFSAAPVDGLKYAAAVLLCFAAGVIFRDTGAMNHRFFMPLVCASCIACMGFVSVFSKENFARFVPLFLCEITFSAVSTWFYAGALDSKDRQTFSDGASSLSAEKIGWLFLGFSLLCSFSDFLIADVISPARAAAMIFVLYTARKHGASRGAAAGLLVGALMDMRAAQQPFYSMTYGISAFAGGLISEKEKFFCILSFFLSYASSAVWGMNQSAALSGLYESFIASVLFFLLPDRYSSHDSEAPAQEFSRRLFFVKSRLAQQISSLSSAFQSACKNLRSSASPVSNKNDEDLSIVFDEAADGVCRKCAIRNVCWEKDYVTTFGALNDTTASIVQKGRADPQDFPSYFSSRCLHFSDFISAINEAVAAMIYRKRNLARMKENSDLIYHHYRGVSEILQNLSAEVKSAPEFLPEDERRIRAAVRRWDENCRVSVSLTAKGRTIVEISGTLPSPLQAEGKRLTSLISGAAGLIFSPPDQLSSPESWSLVFKEAERMSTVIGAAARKKQGKDISGDFGTYFKTEEGTLFVILSDGMGSGREAAAASSSAVRLLESFLQAGLSPKEALNAAWPALCLEADARGFATLDMIGIDLFSGECTLVKCGAAESFFQCGGRLSAMRSTALPPGTGRAGSCPPEPIITRVAPGDWIIMATDGVTSKADEGQIQTIIETHGKENPRDLARQILDAVLEKGPAEDDMTVFALRMTENPLSLPNNLS